jgi:hypothetical protein
VNPSDTKNEPQCGDQEHGGYVVVEVQEPDGTWKEIRLLRNAGTVDEPLLVVGPRVTRGGDA